MSLPEVASVVRSQTFTQTQSQLTEHAQCSGIGLLIRSETHKGLAALQLSSYDANVR